MNKIKERLAQAWSPNYQRADFEAGARYGIEWVIEYFESKDYPHVALALRDHFNCIINEDKNE